MTDRTVDSHLHLFETSSIEYSWIPKGSALDQDYTPQRVRDELMASGVTAAVLVQVGDNDDDTRHMLALAEQWTFIEGVVGWVSLDDPARAAAALEGHASNDWLKGIRCLSHDYADPDWMLQPAVGATIDLVGSAGLALDLVCITERHLRNAVRIAQEHPGVRVAINHLAKPNIAEAVWQPWADLMGEAARCDNAVTKLSGLNTVSRPAAWSALNWQPYVDHVLEHFGAARVMVGSDWPVSTLDGDYVSVWHAQRETLSALSRDEQASIFAGTADDVYSLQ